MEILTLQGFVGSFQNKTALSAVLDVAPKCVDAQLVQAELMLNDKDCGGALLGQTTLNILPF